MEKLVQIMTQHPVSEFGARQANMATLPLDEIDHEGTRRVYKHPDVSGYVVKAASKEGSWANQNEIDASVHGVKEGGRLNIPKGVTKHLADVVEYDKSGEDPYWLIMEEADTENVTNEHGEYLRTQMLEHDWGVEDLHSDNIGLIDGNPVVVDYAYLSPIGEMLPRPKRKVLSGERWEWSPNEE